MIRKCAKADHRDFPVRIALLNAAKHHLRTDVTTKIAGPSNIGNYLAQLGIDATAGLGVRYDALHGTDERIELANVPALQAIYHEVLPTLLTSADASHCGQ
jgi:succinyl-diaminopimelate desuccinylase